jgi:hypothetical protein
VWFNNGQPPIDLNTLIKGSKWTLTTATGINCPIDREPCHAL